MPIPVHAHRFAPHDLIGGHLALDLVNTVTARDSAPADWLADWPTLLQWAALTGAFAPHELTPLARRAAAEPAAARAALARVRQLREALHALVTALALGRPPSPPALAALNALRDAAHRRAPLVATPEGIVAPATLAGSGLDLVVDRVLAQALPLLAAPPLPRLRVCAGPHCGWFFVDQSKAGQRRWCDMTTCGAAHKASNKAAHKAASKTSRARPTTARKASR